jgi:hypothetical protein
MDDRLNSLMEDIIGNPEVKTVWERLLRADGADGGNTSWESYDIVPHQYDLYREKRMEPGVEGYHVASPWSGDIEKARVLFLGSNPGFVPESCGPRSPGCAGETVR